ncbi:hypothetical protein PVAND_002362 [Polypedilum vanderplanki]|uniref:tRNA (cytosine(38)-C(5))-methyltransferase n=2 Tax=Polypedilum vanderplanki TaxID=319348 RepID=A0A9J6BQS0_POLVA|nr:hypothetical protein PVAND_002362 [Polypedilum vanderplanki]
MTELIVLELFSGIGGMHYALKESLVKFKIKAAIDISEKANETYKFNNSNINVINGNIDGLKVKDYQDVNAILMSPPCQPFTRNNKTEQRDLNDHRTDAFVTICKLIKNNEFRNLSYILMENVVGFEKSNMRDIFINALKENDFFFQEFIISPHQLNIPNTRHRYYCIARKISNFKFVQDEILTTIPGFNIDSQQKLPVSHYINPSISLDDFKLSTAILEKRFNVLDICTCDSFNSMCFTKSYSKYLEGTGSVYYSKTRAELNEKIKEIEQNNMDIKLKEALNLRFFSPDEAAHLMCFPDNFKFPENISKTTAYKLIGNSICVKVVSELIKILYHE